MWGWFDPDPPHYLAIRDNADELILRHVKQLAITPTPCSCDMCGHQRKWNGPTLQERRLNDAEDYEEREVLAA